ncbi:diguanylate cyclase [uncultured Shewanella sp.]|uniref:tetratricopeptide repeat-containing diguanylate cyclase n=1 Tax=uncultured Shewanella sp. TaxID=173975 RepID=UPI0026279B7E|nr:diguanylate cyclase [uncultured Shewanella sp.]
MANLLIFFARLFFQSQFSSQYIAREGRRHATFFGVCFVLLSSMCMHVSILAEESQVTDIIQSHEMELIPELSQLSQSIKVSDGHQSSIYTSAQFKQKLDELRPLRGTQVELVAQETDLLLPVYKTMPLALQYEFVFLKGHSFALMGELTKAVHFIEAEMHSPPPEALNALYVKILALLAAIYSDLDDVTQTLQTLNQVVLFLDSVDDIDNEAYVYMMMVEMLSRMTRFDAALQYTDALYATLDKVSNNMRRCYIAGTHAKTVAQALKQDEDQRRLILNYLRKAKSECEAAGENEMVMTQLRLMSEIYGLNGQVEQAKLTFERALTLALKNDTSAELGFIYIYAAKMAMVEGELTVAEAYFLKAIGIAEALNVNRLFVDSTLGLAEVYEAKQVFKKALSYRKLYEEYNEIKIQDLQGELTAFESAKLQRLEKDWQVQNLAKQQTLFFVAEQINERKQTHIRLLMTLLGGSLFFLLLWAGVSFLQKRRYQALAERDPLTGIYNRSAGEEKGMALYQDARKSQQPFSLITLDIDDFKALNDCFGHATGDWVLKKIVEVLNEVIPKDAIFARMGGEEFMILLPNVTEENAWLFANTYRSALLAINTQYTGYHFVVSVSFGVTQAILPDIKLDSLIKRASDAVIFSKNSEPVFISQPSSVMSY